jgi:hypothetical protein
MVLANTPISLLDIRNEHSQLALDNFPISLADYYRGGLYVDSTDAVYTNASIPTFGSISLNGFIDTGYLANAGQTTFVTSLSASTTPAGSTDTLSFTVPENVNRISILCVGGGGGGRGNDEADLLAGGGGGGGGLSYSNNVPVIPGETLTIYAGRGGAGSNGITPGGGGYSAVKRSNGEWLCYAYGGDPGNQATSGFLGAGADGGFGGASVGSPYNLYISGGGNGGDGGDGGGFEAVGGGGGGAGGYTGNGGQGANTSAGYAGSGGGGGGGGAGSSTGNTSTSVAGGGGVGIYGEGQSGAGGTANIGGGGGSGGANGVSGGSGNGGQYGGGGGGRDEQVNSFNGGDGAKGAVKIIWGDLNTIREFPATNVEALVNYNFSDPTINSISYSPLGTTIHINGWDVHRMRAILNGVGSGRSTIGGFTAPLDTSRPANAPINPDYYTIDAFATNYEFITPTDLINGTASGKNCIRLYLSGNTSRNYAIIHGPYVISTNYILLNSGQGFGFNWRGVAGADAYDVYAYLLKDDGTTQKILDETQNGASGDTGWLTVSDTVAATGNYKFVFISGSYDYSADEAVGASLYVTNISVA